MKSKLGNTGKSIFSIMSKMANDHGAINLAQGFPDFKGDQKLINLVKQNLDGNKNQYAPMPGILSLRRALADKINTSYQSGITPNNICLTAGATQAIYSVVAAIISYGDEAIILDPSYDSYAPAIKSFGGIVNNVALMAPDFTFPFDTLKKTITAKTKLIVLNSPHNPTGKVLYSPEFFNELFSIIKNTDIIILSDEVYEHIIFDNLIHHSILSHKELSQRSITTFSFGKSFHFTGWKLGYAVAADDIMKEFHKIHQFNVFSVNHPFQHAISEYLKTTSPFEALPSLFQEKRDYFKSIVDQTKFKWLGTEGSYFALLDYSDLRQEDDMTVAEEFTIQNKIASIPLSPFYAQKNRQTLLRFCFAKKKETLDLAAEKLLAIT